MISEVVSWVWFGQVPKVLCVDHILDSYIAQTDTVTTRN